MGTSWNRFIHVMVTKTQKSEGFHGDGPESAIPKAHQSQSGQDMPKTMKNWVV